jgi:uncharacterized protein (TIGR02646 family)
VIRIQKSQIIPDRLLTKGKETRKRHCISYSRSPKAYQSGEKKFEFDSSIYRHKSVKDVLIQDQYGKCCYCECRVREKGDVEHFRPKSSVQQAKGSLIERPGYYWLAYDWNNLYLSCSVCNRTHKQNYFPLQDSATRVTHHQQNIETEKLLLIDPGKDNPEDHIFFRGASVYEITASGRSTIEVLQLNHSILEEERLSHLQNLKRCQKILDAAKKNMDNDEVKELAIKAAEVLEEAIQPNARYAAAARSAIQTNFHYVPD